MNNIYDTLGFEKPRILENPYGIRIYLGSKNKSDWGIEIPEWIAKRKFGKSATGMMFYDVTEEHALRLAEKYTGIAKSSTY